MVYIAHCNIATTVSNDTSTFSFLSITSQVVKFSPFAAGTLGGLSPTKQSSKPTKLKYETIQISGVFVKIYNAKPPLTNVKPLY